LRPKRKILLIDSNEIKASVTAFTLETNGYAVLRAASIEEAQAAGIPDAVLAYSPIDAAAAAKVAYASLVQLIFVFPTEEGRPKECRGLGYRLLKPSGEELLNALIIACIRKRGPRKGYRIIHGEHVYAAQTPEMEVALA
jgi:hypothetical protein